jgi:hypothetical protein
VPNRGRIPEGTHLLRRRRRPPRPRRRGHSGNRTRRSLVDATRGRCECVRDVTCRRNVVRWWAALVASSVVVAATSTSAVAGSWERVPARSLGTDGLSGVDALSPSQAWAVGGGRGCGRLVGIAARLTGARAVLAAGSPRCRRYVGAVAVRGRGDVWAVGESRGLPAGRLSLVEHWDGARWRTVDSPGVRGHAVDLFAVAAAPGVPDLWAVGQYGHDPVHPAALRWTGERWISYALPGLGRRDQGTAAAVVMTGGSRAWAVGYGEDDRFRSRALVWRWNRRGWRLMAPGIRLRRTDLYGVTASADGRTIWAVGTYYPGGGRQRPIAVQRRRVGEWRASRPRWPRGSRCLFSDVAVVSSRAVWAVGSNGSRPVIDRWNGHRWRRVRAGPLAGIDGYLFAITTVPRRPGRLWAVGSALARRGSRPLVLHRVVR